MNTSNKQTENLLKNFKLLLVDEKVANGTIRSYLSDTRHFLGWLNLFTKSRKLAQTNETLSQIKLIKKKIIEEYLAYLANNGIPLKTINRRLSSLRKFGQFCQTQGWLADNYFAYLKNLTNGDTGFDYYLSAYRAELVSQKTSPHTVKNYLSDIKHFINWLNPHPHA